MKETIYFLFFLYSLSFFSQKKVLKKFDLQTSTLQIDTSGLDNLILENSKSNFVEVLLLAESYDDQLIKVEESSGEVEVKFYFEGTETREIVFRKFITKRLQRAEAIIKVPKEKKIIIYGENVDIESKNCNNELGIFIENGIIKLNTVQQNTELSLYAGNVYAKTKDLKIDLISNIGKIQINNTLYKKEFKLIKNMSHKNLIIKSIKANIFITNQ